jgi:hypothetical protein
VNRSICFPLLSLIGLSTELDLNLIFNTLPDPAAIPLLVRHLEIAADVPNSFSRISQILPVDADTFEPCCRLALTALCAGLPGAQFISSQLFLSIQNLVSFTNLNGLILFLRVVVCADTTWPDGAFLFDVFAQHFDDPKVPLLVLPLIYRYLIGVSSCLFVDNAFVDRLAKVLSE